MLFVEDLFAYGANKIFMAGQLSRYDGKLGPLIAVQEVEDRVYLVVHGRRQPQNVSVCHPL